MQVVDDVDDDDVNAASFFVTVVLVDVGEAKEIVFC